MKKIYLILLLLLFFAIPTAVTADNLTARNGSESSLITQSGYYHDPAYVPETYVWLAILIGFISIAASTFVETDINIFALITPMFWGYAAWFSAFMSRDVFTVVPDGTSVRVVYTEVTYAQPILQYIMTFMFILSVIYAIYTLFLRDADSVSDSRQNVR